MNSANHLHNRNGGILESATYWLSRNNHPFDHGGGGGRGGDKIHFQKISKQRVEWEGDWEKQRTLVF